jgi:transcriptional regulator of acetoin/glycerol metabolism
MTRLHVRQVLEKHGGNVSHAAAALGISRNTVLKYAR